MSIKWISSFSYLSMTNLRINVSFYWCCGIILHVLTKYIFLIFNYYLDWPLQQYSDKKCTYYVRGCGFPACSWMFNVRCFLCTSFTTSKVYQIHCFSLQNWKHHNPIVTRYLMTGRFHIPDPHPNSLLPSKLLISLCRQNRPITTYRWSAFT